ncbi:MAG: hypothetical protein ACQEVT_08935 [Pseudomonadota bacterium]|uniref:hypothetical protein n=1 Tax=Roseovarius TaxID=74030 RepID=UPI0022A84505|nr:hypothetical protein [Roseovarius sp. EGI FJ00037]MCZ0813080.1 hypothetical protein [Roseovarius sp. EGI FJ00037]
MKRRSLFANRSPAVSVEDAYRILDALGPMPAAALAAMIDYGLSDDEIGRYYDLPHDMITTLREDWGIDVSP